MFIKVPYETLKHAFSLAEAAGDPKLEDMRTTLLDELCHDQYMGRTRDWAEVFVEDFEPFKRYLSEGE